MAAEKSTPSKIKDLFSSFLSTVDKTGETGRKRKNIVLSNGKDSHDETESISSPSPTVKDSMIDTDKTSKGTTDSRSKSEFDERVATYSPVKWCAKPMYLSPLVCARYGWTNVDIDMLQCKHCRAFLSGQLPKAVESQTYKDSCHTLKQNLTESHEKLCKWSSSPSPESFTHVPYHNKEELYSDFCTRVISLSKAEDRLPEASYLTLEDSSNKTIITRDKLQDLVNQISSHLLGVEIQCKEKVIVYSIFGWNYCESHKDVHILQCNYCFNKIGLWNFNSKRTNDTKLEEPSMKKTKLEKTNFDPIAGHRYWCPWLQFKNYSTSDRSSLSPATSPIKSPSLNSSPVKHDADPAWFHVAKILSKYKHDGSVEEEFFKQMRQSPQIEGIRHLRQVLKDCASPPGPKFTYYTSTDNTQEC